MDEALDRQATHPEPLNPDRLLGYIHRFALLGRVVQELGPGRRTRFRRPAPWNQAVSYDRLSLATREAFTPLWQAVAFTIAATDDSVRDDVRRRLVDRAGDALELKARHFSDHFYAASSPEKLDGLLYGLDRVGVEIHAPGPDVGLHFFAFVEAVKAGREGEREAKRFEAAMSAHADENMQTVRQQVKQSWGSSGPDAFADLLSLAAWDDALHNTLMRHPKQEKPLAPLSNSRAPHRYSVRATPGQMDLAALVERIPATAVLMQVTLSASSDVRGRYGRTSRVRILSESLDKRLKAEWRMAVRTAAAGLEGVNPYERRLLADVSSEQNASGAAFPDSNRFYPAELLPDLAQRFRDHGAVVDGVEIAHELDAAARAMVDHLRKTGHVRLIRRIPDVLTERAKQQAASIVQQLTADVPGGAPALPYAWTLKAVAGNLPVFAELSELFPGAQWPSAEADAAKTRAVQDARAANARAAEDSRILKVLGRIKPMVVFSSLLRSAADELRNDPDATSARRSNAVQAQRYENLADILEEKYTYAWGAAAAQTATDAFPWSSEQWEAVNGLAGTWSAREDAAFPDASDKYTSILVELFGEQITARGSTLTEVTPGLVHAFMTHVGEIATAANEGELPLKPSRPLAMEVAAGADARRLVDRLVVDPQQDLSGFRNAFLISEITQGTAFGTVKGTGRQRTAAAAGLAPLTDPAAQRNVRPANASHPRVRHSTNETHLGSAAQTGNHRALGEP